MYMRSYAKTLVVKSFSCINTLEGKQYLENLKPARVITMAFTPFLQSPEMHQSECTVSVGL